jgi:hypothetical protein
MTPRPFWLQSDGDLNPQWRRLWTEPPLPKGKRPAAAPTADRPQTKTIVTAVDCSRHQNNSEVRRAAEALFIARSR